MDRYSLIMLQTPLVARDLSLTLEELTRTKCITCAAAEKACQKLADLQPGALLCAFIQSDFQSLKDSPLLALVTALGGQVVLIGHPAEMEAARGQTGPALPVQAEPLGTAQITDVLSRLSSASRQRDAAPS